MNMDISKGLDTVKKGLDQIGDATEEFFDNTKKSALDFHDKYTSKVIPKDGIYKDAANFAADMTPVVGTVKAFKEGGYIGGTISAGFDIGTIAGVGVLAKAGGKVVVGVGKQILKKGASELAEQGAKTVVKEGAETVIKEGTEAVAKKATKELAEEVSEGSVRKFANTAVEKVTSATDDLGKKIIGIKRYDYGQHYKIGPNGLKKLKESAEYVSKEGYGYMTDKLSRITKVNVKELKLAESTRNLHAQRVAGREYRELADEGGHLIANQFGGSGDLDNLVAMTKELNHGQWKQMENTWADALKAGKQVSVKMDLKYPGTSGRPDKIIVKYKIDGETFKKVFENIFQP